MKFTKGNKASKGKGRPRGSGKRQNVSEAFQDFLAGKQGGKERFTLAMERLFKSDLKTFFAYAFGRPTEIQVMQNPDGTALPPISVHVTGGTAPQPRQVEAEKVDWKKLTTAQLLEMQKFRDIATGKIPPEQDNAAAR
jgi:hypothetical protein